MKRFEYFEPHSLEEVLNLLGEYQGKAKLLAGGTDLLIKMKRGILSPLAIINLKTVQGLNAIQSDEKRVQVGVLTAIHTFQKSPLITQRFPILSQAAASIGSRQIRNMGTVGGNLCLDSRCCYYDHSQYWLQSWEKCLKWGGEVCHVRKGDGCEAIISSDLASPLMALKATLRISSLRGERVIPLEEFLTGGKVPNALKEDEVLKEMVIPILAAGTGTALVKYAKRAAIDFPVVSVAAVLRRTPGDGTCGEARVVLGQVFPTPVRATKIESFLLGRRLDPQVLKEVAQVVSKEEMAVSNAEGLGSYKRNILEPLVEQALTEAWNRTELFG